jgi:hypothetical protein
MMMKFVEQSVKQSKYSEKTYPNAALSTANPNRARTRVAVVGSQQQAA